MPGDTRRFRLFVSSTFRDFVAEREALRLKVYPRLRRLCEAHGATFEAVDLRWGVNREAAENQRTMAICLEEVDRCVRATERPNFLLLLGDRLGWRPLPAEIGAGLLEDLQRLLAVDPAHARAAELLKEWYGHARDDNAVPAVHRLDTAGRSAADEAILRRALEDVLDGVPAEAHATLVGGATEQEARRRLASAPIDGGRALVAVRRIVDLPDSRTAAGFTDVDAGGTADVSAQARQQKLRTELDAIADVDRLAYEAQWLGTEISSAHINSLCDDVHDRVAAVIRAELSASSDAADPAREDRLHAAFAAARASDFHGRTDELVELRRWLDGPGGRPLIVHGPSGSGKTTLIAHVLKGPTSPPADVVLARFIGATAASSSPRLLLQGLCRRLAELEAESPYTAPEKLEDLVLEFRRLLLSWPSDRILLLVMDALDQLHKGPDETLAGLSANVPASVHLLVSVLDGTDLDLVRRRLPTAEAVAVEELQRDDASEALDAWLATASPRRTLQRDQRAAILEAFGRTGLPLHLRLLFEQARTWTSDQRLGELPPSIEATIDQLFDRLSRPDEHGLVVVGAALGYLAAARDGLTSTELVDVLSVDAETMNDFRARQPDSPPTDVLPAIVWSRLLFDLDAYLTEREQFGTPTLDFFHRQFREVVARRWLTPSGGALHARLATYFATLETWLRSDAATAPNRRKLAELPYQYVQAGDWEAVDALLTDPDTLCALVEGLGPAELVDDLDRILEPSRLSEVEARLDGVERLRALRRAASASSPIVAEDPAQLPSQLLGRIATEHASLRDRLRGPWRRGWLEPLRPTLEAGWLRFVLSGHRGTVRTLAVSADGRLCASAGNSSPDRTIRIWSLERGTQLRALDDLVDAGGETPLAFDSAGHLLVGHGRKVLRVDVLSGRTDVLLDTGGDAVACLAAAANAPVVVTGAGRALFVLRPGGADDPKTLSLADAPVKVAVTLDGRRAAALTANGAFLLDLDPPAELARCKRAVDIGSGFWARPPLAVSPSGETVSFGRDLVRWHPRTGKVRWRPRTGKVEEVVAAAKTRWMDAPRAVLALTPEGRRALVSPSFDDDRDMGLSSDQSRSIADWSIGAVPSGPAIKGPGMQISTAALTPAADAAVVAYYDHSVRVWELGASAGGEPTTHDNPVTRIVVEGELAATKDAGNIVLFWSLSTGRRVDQQDTPFAGESLEGLLGLLGRADAHEEPDPSGGFSSLRWMTSSGGGRAVRYQVSTAKRSEAPDPPDVDAAPLPFEVWDLDDEGRLAERRHEPGPAGPDRGLTRVVVSHDGRRAVAAGWGSLRVFDLELGCQLVRLTGHTRPVWSVAFADGDRLAASASEDSTLRAWDVETGACVAVFTGESPMRVCEAAVLPGDTTPRLIAGEESGRVHILRLHPATRR